MELNAIQSDYQWWNDDYTKHPILSVELIVCILGTDTIEAYAEMTFI